MNLTPFYRDSVENRQFGGNFRGEFPPSSVSRSPRERGTRILSKCLCRRAWVRDNSLLLVYAMYREFSGDPWALTGWWHMVYQRRASHVLAVIGFKWIAPKQTMTENKIPIFEPDFPADLRCFLDPVHFTGKEHPCRETPELNSNLLWKVLLWKILTCANTINSVAAPAEPRCEKVGNFGQRKTFRKVPVIKFQAAWEGLIIFRTRFQSFFGSFFGSFFAFFKPFFVSM